MLAVLILINIDVIKMTFSGGGGLYSAVIKVIGSLEKKPFLHPV